MRLFYFEDWLASGEWKGAVSIRAALERGGSVCLNSFSGLISGFFAVVMKMMDRRSGTA
jgi:hypothetical protein